MSNDQPIPPTEWQRRLRQAIDRTTQPGSGIAMCHEQGKTAVYLSRDKKSTYSGRSRPDIVRMAKRLGYATNAVFLGTDDPNINISRVGKRVSEGGHHIDDSEVRRRWTAAWRNLIATWGSFDTVEGDSGRKRCTFRDSQVHERA